MQLTSISYSEYLNEPQEWILEKIKLGSKNLVVGKNSAGKSRTLNVIYGISRTLSTPRPVPPAGQYNCEWKSSDGKVYKYEYSIKNSLVLKEKLTIDETVYLERYDGGIGKIFAEKIGDGIYIPFQTPQNEFAILKRRDSMQHSFIEPLYQWATAVRSYHFGQSLGKDHLIIVVQNGPAVDETDENQVVALFRAGVKEYGKAFTSALIKDMAKIGYEIDSITTGQPITIKFEGTPGDITSIHVKEKGLKGITDQLGMSQGMYRVLALLIHVNYLQFKKSSTCVIVDDIGEGLDYERSCKIISLLRSKADESNLQIIMSTNDKFVMNEVPLNEWTVLQRNGSRVEARNYENSAEKFDEFKFTGLSNFSFFEMDFLNDEVNGEQ